MRLAPLLRCAWSYSRASTKFSRSTKRVNLPPTRCDQESRMDQQELPLPVMKIVLGHELERQRKAAGLTQTTVAAKLGTKQQNIAYVENGGGIKLDMLTTLLDLYHSSESDCGYCLDLQAEGDGWTKRSGFRSRFRENLRLVVDIEQTCQRLYSYQTLLVPGLLQTERYMRTLFRAWRPSPSADQIDTATDSRIARQRVLANTEQQFWFVLDE